MCGAVAMVFQRASVPSLVAYLQGQFFASPVDWLIGKYFANLKQMATFERAPSLVQHMGARSSFKGNGAERQKFKSISFVLNASAVPTDSYDAAHMGDSPYIGCFADRLGTRDRDLSGLFDWSGAHKTPKKCAEFCKLFRYFALQNGAECYCGNEYGSYGALPETKCAMPGLVLQCPFPVGGALANAVFKWVFVLLPLGSLLTYVVLLYLTAERGWLSIAWDWGSAHRRHQRSSCSGTSWRLAEQGRAEGLFSETKY
jgi:hypothetical protein